MKTYAIIYLGSTLLALVITPLVILVARHLKVVDAADIRKVHSRSVPRIGGVAIFASVICLMVPLLFLQNAVSDSVRNILLRLIVVFSAATFIFVVGLIDDIIGLRARIKFFTELIAAIVVCAIGIRIKSVAIADWLSLDFGWFSWPLTILWITGITNAVNLSDGLDGLAAGISAVACAVIAIFAIYSGQIVMAIIMLALLGSLTGFLFYNFNPAKVFMGDCGSLFIGFTISTSSVMCSTKSPTLIGLALPLLALGIPVFDTLSAILRRFLERRSVFSPDRQHFHHKLLDMGLAQRQVVILAYVVTLLTAGLGMFMMATHDINTLIVFGCILLLLLLLFRVVSAVRLQEAIAAVARKYAIARQIKQETECFEEVQLYFRQAKTFDQWWQAVCTAAQQLGFSKLRLPLKNGNGPHHTLTWRRDGNEADRFETLKMKIPIRSPGTNSHLNIEVDVTISSSLESAGHRAALFSRLLDEHSMLGIPIHRISSPSGTSKHTAEY